MEWTAIARSQAGVISRQQLTGADLTEREVQWLVHRGSLQPIHPHTYVHCSMRPNAQQRLWAAALWSGGVISHRSGARVWNVEVPVTPVVHVTVGDLRFRRRADGVRVHRVEFASREVCDVDGLPVTSRTRTVIDLLRTEPRGSITALLDRAIQRDWLTATDLRRAVMDQPGRTGNVRLRELLAQIEPGAHAESERLLHRLLRAGGVTGWRPQLKVRLPTRTVLLDVGFRQHRVGIEVDGRKYHDEHSDRFEDDRVRQNLLAGSGWIILRVTWRRLNDEPAAVIAEIKSTLKRRD